MNIKLVRLSPSYRKQLQEMMELWLSTETDFSPAAIRGADYRDFDSYLRYIESREDSSAMSSGYVPSTVWFALDEDRDIFVGAVDIRHYLNDGLLYCGGHIGDGIRPDERRKGYATRMIALALDKCSQMGLSRVLMVCAKTNIGSAKSIINNGGVLENEVLEDGIVMQRYWIDLCESPGTYPELLSFWDGCYGRMEKGKPDVSVYGDATLDRVLKQYVPASSRVLDYGCGTGWMLGTIASSCNIASGIGIDPCNNAVESAAEYAKACGYERLSFLCGDEKTLCMMQGSFDFAVTVNVLDVVPDEVVFRILPALHSALKSCGVLLVCLNPSFSLEQTTGLLRMERREDVITGPESDYFYRDGILRCNRKSPRRWESIFSCWFEVLEHCTFYAHEGEKKYPPRQMFVLKKRG